MVTIGRDDLIARLQRHLHADNDGFLADIEVAETADVTHAVELAGLFFETADQQHALVSVETIGARHAGCRLLMTIAGGALGSRSGARRFFRSHRGALLRGCDASAADY